MAFPLAAFRELYPEFNEFSDAAVLAVSEQALCYISEGQCECGDSGWMLMVAHILYLRQQASSGGGGVPGGSLASASIDKVSVSFNASPGNNSSYGFWLGGSPYGLELLAMLSRCAVGGLYVGGSGERAAFRIVGGRFPMRGRNVW